MKKPAHLSTAGAKFIARYEGLRTVPYNDPVGFATIGIGHLLHRSRVTLADVRRWRAFKKTDAYALLSKDAESFAAAVRKHGWKLTQAQFDALVSFSFNVGTAWLIDSGLKRALDRHASGPAVIAEFVKWDVGGGQHLPGLHHRREAEAHLFVTGRYV